jgi:hypothetical protein
MRGLEQAQACMPWTRLYTERLPEASVVKEGAPPCA